MSDTIDKCIMKRTCPYQIFRGAKSGEVCGSGVRGEATYCAKHKPTIKAREEAAKRSYERRTALMTAEAS